MENPKPYCIDRENFKVFVLGADPTNFSGPNKEMIQLEYAFGINSDEPRYFNSILKNLKALDLELKDLYVQNVVPEYLEEETSKNKNWEKKATEWLPILKQELDGLDPDKKKPAFITAERIMKFLCLESFKLPKAKEIYSEEAKELSFVKAEDNKLERPLIAFYRHPSYHLLRKNQYTHLLKSNKLF